MKLTNVRGVYAIENTVTGKRYIGSATNLSVRRSQHMNALKRECHHSVLLQRAYQKYGREAFDFKVLLVCSKENQLFYEQLMMDGFKSHDPEYGYNIAKNAEAPYGTSTEASRAKNSFLMRQRAKKYDFRGEQLCIVEIAERIGMPFRLLMCRVNDRGWDIEKAVTHKRRNPLGKRHVPKNLPRKDGTPRRSRATKFKHNGLSMKLADWARHIGCEYSSLSNRLKTGWDFEKAITTPFEDNRKFITFNGKTLTMSQWAKELGMQQQTLAHRLGRLGWSAERALTAKPAYYHHEASV